jgi:hypothetical protein
MAGAVYPAGLKRHQEESRMAKSKVTAKRSGKPGASARAASRNKQPAPRVGKGKLEVGNARLETGVDVKATPTARRVPRAAAKRPGGDSSLQLPDEKAVRPTGATLPVKPARPSPGDREPLPDAAVDRRRQVVGTDDKPRPARR